MSPASPFDPSSRRPPSAAGERPLATAQAQAQAQAQVQVQRGPELALEIEFEQLWEAGEEERRAVQGEEEEVEEGEELAPGKRRRPWALDEQDREEMRTERRRCFVVDDEGDGA